VTAARPNAVLPKKLIFSVASEDIFIPAAPVQPDQMHNRAIGSRLPEKFCCFAGPISGLRPCGIRVDGNAWTAAGRLTPDRLGWRSSPRTSKPRGRLRRLGLRDQPGPNGSHYRLDRRVRREIFFGAGANGRHGGPCSNVSRSSWSFTPENHGRCDGNRLVIESYDLLMAQGHGSFANYSLRCLYFSSPPRCPRDAL